MLSQEKEVKEMRKSPAGKKKIASEKKNIIKS